MNLVKLENNCIDAEAPNAFPYTYNAISAEKILENRFMLTKLPTMAIIYVVIFGQSQKSIWFQIALSITLMQYEISECGLAALRNLGIAAHPHNFKTAVAASGHLQHVQNFSLETANKEHYIVIFIYRYHNVHTKHCAYIRQQRQVVHMATF